MLNVFHNMTSLYTEVGWCLLGILIS